MLSLAILTSGLAAIACDFDTRRKGFYLFKPLTTLLLIALAVLLLPAAPERSLLLAALGFCLLGDVALMADGKRAFAVGLAAFLVGHGLFIAAFWQHADGTLPHPAWWLLALPMLAYFAFLKPHLGKLWPAVGLYLLALLGMVLAAAGTAVPLVHTHFYGAYLLLLGALLFLASDAVLAWRRFVAPFRWGQATTLASYYGGLWCIVMGSAP